MGRLIFSAICSLDGYTADPEGSFDWAAPDDEVLEDLNAEARSVATYLYGRRMYEVASAWESGAEASTWTPRSPEFAELWRAADKVVYSRTLEDVATARTRLERDFEALEVAELKRRSPDDLYIDGPTLAAEAFRHGLVDRISLVLCPVIIGDGLRALPREVRIDLRLVGHKRYRNGMVRLVHDVVR